MQNLVDQISLQRLDAQDAFKLALMQSGLTTAEVAKRMDWTEAVARRVFSLGRYYPSFEDLPRLCHVLGNSVLLQWLQVQALRVGLDEVHLSVDCRSLLNRIGELFSEMGDVGQQGAEAIADGRLEVDEVRRIISELTDVLDKAGSLLGDLRALERQLVEEHKAKKGAGHE